ncbi:MAG: hypothetical protein NTW38_04360, partial [Candidatus Aminicenantes bacterium]|nr:hypothetical protein [Candidatus Aminicenantes bacterium]
MPAPMIAPATIIAASNQPSFRMDIFVLPSGYLYLNLRPKSTYKGKWNAGRANCRFGKTKSGGNWFSPPISIK